MKEKFFPPKFSELQFHCPICGVYSHQFWSDAYYSDRSMFVLNDVSFSICAHCGEASIWHKKIMVHPTMGGVPLPNQDLPQEIMDDYLEAREILSKSPRGASALLRLSIQKLCKHLGQNGKTINDDIAGLVKAGLPTRIQQALDYVRVIGNHSVHPGQIDLKDNYDIALNLFSLINIIADNMITQPKEIDNLYKTLPEDQINAIDKRDKKASL